MEHQTGFPVAMQVCESYVGFYYYDCIIYNIIIEAGGWP